jgi:hypothetical protein
MKFKTLLIKNEKSRPTLSSRGSRPFWDPSVDLHHICIIMVKPIINRVKVHPVVIFSILDHYIRRNEGYRVIGTLTGNMNDGIIEIKNCYPVPHTEGEQVIS